MRKRIAVFAVVLAVMMCFTGCMSPLAKSIEQQKIYMSVTEMLTEDLKSDEQGFHYPGLTWDMNLDDISKVNYSSVKNYLGYSESGEFTYEMSGMFSSALDRKADSVAISLLKDSQVYLISIMFTQDGEKKSPMKNEELWTKGFEKLTELFGEPEDYKEEEHEVESSSATIPTKTLTYTWSAPMADGTLTQIQWASATVSYSEEPTYVMLGIYRELKK